jgi:hypothetical protein
MTDINVNQIIEELFYEDWDDYLFVHHEHEKPIETKINPEYEKLEMIKDKMNSFYDETMTLEEQQGFIKAVVLLNEIIDNALQDLKNGE